LGSVLHRQAFGQGVHQLHQNGRPRVRLRQAGRYQGVVWRGGRRVYGTGELKGGGVKEESLDGIVSFFQACTWQTYVTLHLLARAPIAIAVLVWHVGWFVLHKFCIMIGSWFSSHAVPWPPLICVLITLVSYVKRQRKSPRADFQGQDAVAVASNVAWK